MHEATTGNNDMSSLRLVNSVGTLNEGLEHSCWSSMRGNQRDNETPAILPELPYSGPWRRVPAQCFRCKPPVQSKCFELWAILCHFAMIRAYSKEISITFFGPC